MYRLKMHVFKVYVFEGSASCLSEVVHWIMHFSPNGQMGRLVFFHIFFHLQHVQKNAPEPFSGFREAKMGFSAPLKLKERAHFRQEYVLSVSVALSVSVESFME